MSPPALRAWVPKWTTGKRSATYLNFVPHGPLSGPKYTKVEAIWNKWMRASNWIDFVLLQFSAAGGWAAWPGHIPRAQTDYLAAWSSTNPQGQRVWADVDASEAWFETAFNPSRNG